jgi:hypothetical protein
MTHQPENSMFCIIMPCEDEESKPKLRWFLRKPIYCVIGASRSVCAQWMVEDLGRETWDLGEVLKLGIADSRYGWIAGMAE